VLGLPPFATSPGDRYPDPPGGVQIIIAGVVVPAGGDSRGAIALEAPPSTAVAAPEVATPTSTASGAQVHAAGQSEAEAHASIFAWQ
jgi:hypothetical protein